MIPKRGEKTVGGGVSLLRWKRSRSGTKGKRVDADAVLRLVSNERNGRWIGESLEV